MLRSNAEAHPLDALLERGVRPYPDDICDMILRIHARDPKVLARTAHTRDLSPDEIAEVIAEEDRWARWGRGEDLEEARSFLQGKLDELDTIHEPSPEDPEP
ncbi:MAG TPA: hypothetical protein VM328_13865 [Fimbriimonadaceae bacterium]|nr:hypothetical protein [Fimbriimonadaceae bacterium]